jgi:hypothetical protein
MLLQTILNQMNSIYSRCIVFANICMLTIPFFLIRRHHYNYNTRRLHKFDKRITPNIRTVPCLDLILLFIAHAIKRCYSPPSPPTGNKAIQCCQLLAKHFHLGLHCELFLTKKQQSAQTLQLLNSSIELSCDGVFSVTCSEGSAAEMTGDSNMSRLSM